MRLKLGTGFGTHLQTDLTCIIIIIQDPCLCRASTGDQPLCIFLIQDTLYRGTAACCALHASLQVIAAMQEYIHISNLCMCRAQFQDGQLHHDAAVSCDMRTLIVRICAHHVL